MRRPVQRGLSLVELLVGTAVGLLVAAAAAGVLASHLRESRRLQIEARFAQDLQGTVDIVVRDLRRAGHWAAAASGLRSNSADAGAAEPVANPHGIAGFSGAASDAVRLSFSRDASESTDVDAAERFGYRLRRGVIEAQLGAGNWQALGDSGSAVVTAFTLESRLDATSLAAFCDRPCSAGSTTCPPMQTGRSMTVSLAARSVADPALTRTLRSELRVRNDVVVGRCEG